MSDLTVSLKGNELDALCKELREEVVAMCKEADSGHIGGCLGAVELLAALYFGGVLRYKPSDPLWGDRDRVLIRGHLGPLRYALFSHLGWVDRDELGGYASYGSRLQGHEDHQVLPGVDVTPSGSLGMLLSYGVGVAVAARENNKRFRTFVFLGDGEEQEGSVAEAARHAGQLGLSSLFAIIDANGKQLSDAVSDVDGTDLAALWRAYGWRVVEVAEGNDIGSVQNALLESVGSESTAPTVLIVQTTKGYGLGGADGHFSGYHEVGHCPDDLLDEVVPSTTRVSGRKQVRTAAADPDPLPEREIDIRMSPDCPTHPDQAQLAYFRQLCDRWQGGTMGNIYFLTADTFPSPLLDRTSLRSSACCMNVGLREQHLVSLAQGISLTEPNSLIIAHMLDAFMPRAFDQISALVSSGANAVIIGDDAGMTNARNGKTHQSSWQPLAFSTMPGVVMLEPADTGDLFNCLNQAVRGTGGITYIRIHDGDLSPLPVDADGRNTDCYDVVGDPDPDILIVGSGFMLGACLQACDILRREGVRVRLLNVVSPTSLEDRIADVVDGIDKVLTVYNGHPDTLFNPVARAVGRLATGPRAMRPVGFHCGTSGSLDDLAVGLGLDAASIARAAREIL